MIIYVDMDDWPYSNYVDGTTTHGYTPTDTQSHSMT